MGVHSLCDTRHSERSFVANNLTKGNTTCLINSLYMLLLKRSAADKIELYQKAGLYGDRSTLTSGRITA